MPKAKQRRICRKEYRASKLREREPFPAHAPAPRSDLKEWVGLLAVSLIGGLILLEILNWAARPHF
jgi:hypothetical protein